MDGMGNWLRRARIGWRFQVASQSKIVIDPRLPSRFASLLNKKFVITWQSRLRGTRSSARTNPYCIIKSMGAN
jgi:hypothetical protein